MIDVSASPASMPLGALLDSRQAGDARQAAALLCAWVVLLAESRTDLLASAQAGLFDIRPDQAAFSVARPLLRPHMARALREGRVDTAQHFVALMLAFEESAAFARMLRPVSTLLAERAERAQPLLLDGLVRTLARPDVDATMLQAIAGFATAALDLVAGEPLSDAEHRLCLALSRYTAARPDIPFNFSAVLRRFRLNLLDRVAKADPDDLDTPKRLLADLWACFPEDASIKRRLGVAMQKQADALFTPKDAQPYLGAVDALMVSDLWTAAGFRKVFRQLLQLGEIYRAEQWLQLSAARHMRTDDVGDTLLLGEFAVLAGRLRETGDFACLERLIDGLRQHVGDSAELRYQESLLRLSLGDFDRGWRLMRSRLKTMPLPAGVASLPPWDGRTHVPALLLWWPAGAGIGGEVMRLVFLQQVFVCAGRVGLICDARLHPALSRTFPDLALLPHEALDVVQQGYSHAFDLISLPAVFEGRVPAPIRLLTPDPIRSASVPLSAAPGRRLRCGFSWFTTNPRSRVRRSLPGVVADRLLAAFPEIDFYSLQHGLQDAQTNRLADASRLIESAQPETDTEGLLALIAAMDVVVTIDNSVAHFCGALNIPGVVLLPAIAEPQWASSGSTSPLYPSLHLVRQKQPGRWQDAVTQVEDILSGLIGIRLLVDTEEAKHNA